MPKVFRRVVHQRLRFALVLIQGGKPPGLLRRVTQDVSVETTLGHRFGQTASAFMCLIPLAAGARVGFVEAPVERSVWIHFVTACCGCFFDFEG
jgi:hypothetical protein